VTINIEQRHIGLAQLAQISQNIYLKFMCHVQNYYQPKRMHSDVCKNLWQASHICCNALFSPGVVFAFELSLWNCLQHCTSHITVKWVLWVEVWQIWWPLGTHFLRWTGYNGACK